MLYYFYPLILILVFSLTMGGADFCNFLIRKYQLGENYYRIGLMFNFTLTFISFYQLIIFIDEFLSAVVLNLSLDTFLTDPLTGGGLLLYTMNVALIIGACKFHFYTQIRDFEQYRKEFHQKLKAKTNKH